MSNWPETELVLPRVWDEESGLSEFARDKKLSDFDSIKIVGTQFMALEISGVIDRSFSFLDLKVWILRS